MTRPAYIIELTELRIALRHAAQKNVSHVNDNPQHEGTGV